MNEKTIIDHEKLDVYQIEFDAYRARECEEADD
jgi:hypothetical protein